MIKSRRSTRFSAFDFLPIPGPGKNPTEFASPSGGNGDQSEAPPGPFRGQTKSLAPHHCWLANRINAPAAINTATRIPTTSEATNAEGWATFSCGRVRVQMASINSGQRPSQCRPWQRAMLHLAAQAAGLRCAEAMVEVQSNSNLCGSANSGSRTNSEFRGDACWPLLACRPAGFLYSRRISHKGGHR